jgi:DNA sulfur modification protein DndD
MEPDNLSLRNFRQFRDAEITFSKDSEKNVTVIHGQNGSGKTTIRNAFLWVLYDTLESIKMPERVANQGEMVAADVGDSVPVEVKLVFNHDGLRHEVRRRKVFQKQSDDDLEGIELDETFTVEYLTEAGNVEEPTNPESYIRQIIPNDLAGLFFFDGEYISDLSGVDNQEEIQQAIRQMMGLTIMERSIKHLDWVEGQFRNELRDLGSEELQSLIEERDDAEDEKDSLKQKFRDKKEEKRRLQNEVEEINELLSQVGETRKLQEQREELEAERDELEEEVSELNDRLESRISATGFLPFALPAIRETAQDLDDLREEGKIPSQLDNQLVDELLNEKECICGRPLPEGSAEAETVSSYKSDVTADGVDEASIRLIDKLDRIRDEYDEFYEDIDDVIDRRASLEDEIEDLNGKIDDIGVKIEELGQEIEGLDTADLTLNELELQSVESVSDLEAARAAKKERIEDELKEEIVILERDIKDLEEKIEGLEDDIDEAEDEQREADLARKRMQAAKAVREELEIYYEEFQQSIRKRANNRVDETFDEVATKDYEAVITDDFELRIRDRQHGTPIEVDKSRGERQIASLAFISSLVEIAREQYESDHEGEYFDGGIYPIVMDSPFGALDNEHRAEVSQMLPLLADQVVVLVTDSQWEGPVQREMGPSVGAHYQLDYEENGGIQGSPVTEINEISRRSQEVRN